MIAGIFMPLFMFYYWTLRLFTDLGSSEITNALFRIFGTLVLIEQVFDAFCKLLTTALQHYPDENADRDPIQHLSSHIRIRQTTNMFKVSSDYIELEIYGHIDTKLKSDILRALHRYHDNLECHKFDK